MKRVLISVFVMSLLLCGCCNVFVPGTVDPTEAPTPAPTDGPAIGLTEPPVFIEPATEPVIEPATEPVTEPTQSQETVTVYLVDRTVYFDSGYVAYSYDENFNIISYDVYTIENDLMYSTVFTEHNAYGMPCKFIQYEENWTLSWFEDGKIKEAQEGSGFSGYQYEYDQKGDIIEKRGYYEGILVDTVYYEYDGSELIRVYCEDAEGNNTYACRVENGIIIEKSFSLENGGISYFYEYDEEGNLIEAICLYEGEQIPVQIHTYKAVEVDADRAAYLLQQQKYLLSVT